MNCEFCNKGFTTKSSMNHHLRTAKYCLKLRGAEVAAENTFDCDGCGEKFNLKSSMTQHKKICKVDVNNLTKMIQEDQRKVIADQRKELAEKDKQLLEQLGEKDKQLLAKDREIDILKAQLREQLLAKDKRIIEVEAKLEIYKEQVEAKDEYIQSLANSPTKSTHTMHQHIGEVNQQVLSLEQSSCNLESLAALVDDLTFDVIRNGQKGTAGAFKGTNGQTKMLCTDSARDVFKHLDENGFFKDFIYIIPTQTKKKMSTISFSLSDLSTICQHYKLDAHAVLAVLTGSDPMGRAPTDLLTDKEKNGLIKWGEERLFNKIALFLGHMIHKICPFRTKDGYDTILIGTAGPDVTHKHYLGWNVSAGLPEENISVKELTERVKNPEIQKRLEAIFNLSHEFLIIPMMNLMFEKGNEIYQNEMNRYLNLDKLDGCKQQGWVTAELFQRMCSQGIMEKIPKIGNHAYHRKVQGRAMNYKPPVFVMPTRIGFSEGHQTTLRILENLVKKHSFFKGGGMWTITNEYTNPYKHGYPGAMRYDIALCKNNALWGLIEFDGKQHYEYTPHFHRGGSEQFKALQAKDVIKNADARLLCKGKECLRVGPNYGGPAAQGIKKNIIDWLTM